MRAGVTRLAALPVQAKRDSAAQTATAPFHIKKSTPSTSSTTHSLLKSSKQSGIFVDRNQKPDGCAKEHNVNFVGQLQWRTTCKRSRRLDSRWGRKRRWMNMRRWVSPISEFDFCAHTSTRRLYCDHMKEQKDRETAKNQEHYRAGLINCSFSTLWRSSYGVVSKTHRMRSHDYSLTDLSRQMRTMSLCRDTSNHLVSVVVPQLGIPKTLVPASSNLSLS